jgi:hypothetical protein
LRVRVNRSRDQQHENRERDFDLHGVSLFAIL